MKTFVVWVLYISSYGQMNTGNPAPAMSVIDNIASQQNCQAIAARIAGATPGNVRMLCVAVRKVAP